MTFANQFLPRNKLRVPLFCTDKHGRASFFGRLLHWVMILNPWWGISQKPVGRIFVELSFVGFPGLPIACVILEVGFTELVGGSRSEAVELTRSK